MEDLPATQTQEYIEGSQERQEEIQLKRPWGRLCSYIPTMTSIDLFELEYTFGRAPSCNILVDKSQYSMILNISKEHFKLTKGDDNLIYLKDLSKNGTFINRNKVGKNNSRIIFNDDVIAIGQPSSQVYSFVSNLNRADYEFLPQEMWQKYRITRQLGKGAFGQVRLAFDQETLEQFAIKKIDKCKSSIVSTRQNTPSQTIRTEVEILTSFSHAFIIQMREVFETQNEVFLVLEYMSGGELKSRIMSSLPFPELEVKFVFYQILIGVRYLHMNGVTHRDLKPENILLSSQDPYPLVKITDFGLSKIMDNISVMATVCGTPQYVAPEIIKFYEPYDKKVDVWSLGVILFFMLSRQLPFAGSTQETTAKNIISGNITWDSRVWKSFSLQVRSLIKSMLTVDPTRRCAIVDVFKQDWIAKDSETQRKVENLQFDNSSDELQENTPKRMRISFL